MEWPDNRNWWVLVVRYAETVVSGQLLEHRSLRRNELLDGAESCIFIEATHPAFVPPNRTNQFLGYLLKRRAVESIRRGREHGLD